jgi:hypothetical protein
MATSDNSSVVITDVTEELEYATGKMTLTDADSQVVPANDSCVTGEKIGPWFVHSYR